MKFSFLQDLDPMTNGGGAQLTDRAMVVEGIRRGHDVELCLPHTGVLTTNPVIVSNATSFSIQTFQELHKREVPYVWFLHDYWPACKYRLFYPMRQSCQSCYLKERWLPILKGAKLIVWLAPLHRDSWLWLYPELQDTPYLVTPSPVPDTFCGLGNPRSGVVVVEGLHPFKGRRHIIRWAEQHPDVPITVVGGNPGGGPLPRNIGQVYDQVPYDQMVQVYNQAEALLHLPSSPTPFDRIVAEALMSGCKVIGNSLIGALSYEWFKDRPAVVHYCHESSRVFWEKIEEVFD